MSNRILFFLLAGAGIAGLAYIIAGGFNETMLLYFSMWFGAFVAGSLISTK